MLSLGYMVLKSLLLMACFLLVQTGLGMKSPCEVVFNNILPGVVTKVSGKTKKEMESCEKLLRNGIDSSL